MKVKLPNLNFFESYHIYRAFLFIYYNQVSSILFNTKEYLQKTLTSNYLQSVSYLVTALTDNGTSIILSGKHGSGKASLFRDEYLHNKPEGTDISVLLIHANEFLTCQSLWERLNEVFEWKHSNYYEPVGNKKLVVFIKDLQNLQVLIIRSKCFIATL